MRLSIRFAPVVFALSVGCSGGSGDDGAAGAGGTGPTGDARLTVPEGLPNTETEGQEGGLTLTAFTLTPGAEGLELYAAVRNDGDTPACEPGMMTEVYGPADQLVTSVGSVVQSGHFYRIDDGSGVVLSCIPPGKVGMSVAKGLPAELALEQVAALKHAFPAFTVAGIVPVEGIAVSGVRSTPEGEGHVFTGTFANGLEVGASGAKVTIFPVNRVGRPLGAAEASAPMDVPAGGSWEFRTSSVGDLGAGTAVYPAASVSFAPSGG